MTFIISCSLSYLRFIDVVSSFHTFHFDNPIVLSSFHLFRQFISSISISSWQSHRLISISSTSSQLISSIFLIITFPFLSSCLSSSLSCLSSSLSYQLRTSSTMVFINFHTYTYIQHGISNQTMSAHDWNRIEPRQVNIMSSNHKNPTHIDIDLTHGVKKNVFH